MCPVYWINGSVQSSLWTTEINMKRLQKAEERIGQNVESNAEDEDKQILCSFEYI